MMVFKEPLTWADFMFRCLQRDTLASAADVLDACKVEPDAAALLRRLASQMDTALISFAAEGTSE